LAKAQRRLRRLNLLQALEASLELTLLLEQREQ